MSKKFVNVYFALSLIVFILALSIFASNLIKEYKYQASNSLSFFTEISNNFENESLLDSVSKYQDDPSIIACQISRNEKILFNKTDNFNFDTKSKLIKTFEAKKTINEENYSLKLAIYLISPESIYQNAKKTFYIILALTILTALLIALNAIDTRENKTSEPKYSEDDSDSDANIEDSISLDDIEADSKTQTYSQEEIKIPEEVSESTTTSLDETTEEKKDFSSEKKFEIEDTSLERAEKAENTENIENIENTENTENAEVRENNITLDEKYDSLENEDIAIFDEKSEDNSSPLNNPFVDNKNEEKERDSETRDKEEVIKSPLEAKLKQIIDENVDFSLFLLKSPSSDYIATIKEILTPGFFEKEMVFDFNSDTLALIKSKMTIEDAETFASNFHTAIADKLSNCITKVGISSRSTRIITAERLITEVIEALKHAQADKDSHIIGFHVDIEKYNEYLQNS